MKQKFLAAVPKWKFTSIIMLICIAVPSIVVCFIPGEIKADSLGWVRGDIRIKTVVWIAWLIVDFIFAKPKKANDKQPL